MACIKLEIAVVHCRRCNAANKIYGIDLRRCGPIHCSECGKFIADAKQLAETGGESAEVRSFSLAQQHMEGSAPSEPSTSEP